MKIKVLHLLSHLNMGGAETLITDYALNFDKENFEFVIVTMQKKKGSINEQKLKRNGIKVIHLGDNLFFPDGGHLFKRVVNKLHRYLLFHMIVRKEKPKIIHTHLRNNNYLLPIRLKKNGIKSFHTIHNEVNVMFNTFLHKFSTKRAVKHQGMKLLSLHTRMKKEADQLFNINSTIVVPNAIELQRFQDVEINKKELLYSLNINEKAFVMGHIGRFSYQKNHDFLIDIFSEVKALNPNSQLILIGIGEKREEIEEKVNALGIEDSVSFLGNRGDIPELLKAMDAFVFPSQFEGFGNVLIEAQAAELKSVVSDSIPGDAIKTNLVKTLSLNRNAKTWAEEILNFEKPRKIEGELYQHDIYNVVNRLKEIYLSE